MNDAKPFAQVWIPAGEFLMGSDRNYPEEGPVRRVAVAGFSIDRHLVTNARYADFVAATGYVTVAEGPLDPAEFPGAPPENLVAGSMVFTPPPARSTCATSASGGRGPPAPRGTTRRDRTAT